MTTFTTTRRNPAHWRYGDALDAVQTGLAIARLLPGVGAPFDGANALISLARGDTMGAALAAAAMIPGAGVVCHSSTMDADQVFSEYNSSAKEGNDDAHRTTPDRSGAGASA